MRHVRRLACRLGHTTPAAAAGLSPGDRRRPTHSLACQRRDWQVPSLMPALLARQQLSARPLPQKCICMRTQVRSLGRGGGWGPLRRAPIQHLDMKGRPGLLRTVLEQQETRGLTRADDLSRLLPSEVRYINPVLCRILAFPTVMMHSLTHHADDSSARCPSEAGLEL